MPKTFLWEEKGAIARLTLNRPEVLNALTFDVYHELRDVFAGLEDKPALRVVVIAGAGRGFCSGGDVKEIIGRLAGQSDEVLLNFTRLTCEVILRMREAPQIFIASINGVAAGAGAVMAMASDLRIASTEARIAFLFTKVGLTGADMGAAHLLPRIVGAGRAAELLLRGDFIDARTAEAWGLFNRVVAPERLEAETASWAETLARGPALGQRMTKHIMNRGMGMNLAEALELEAGAQAVCMKHPDFAEAYEAFVQKRPPVFGRGGASSGGNG